MYKFELTMVRVSVLNDLEEFVQGNSYINAKTESERSLIDRDLAEKLKSILNANPQLISPRQLAAISLLDRISSLGMADLRKKSKIKIHKNVYLSYVKEATERYVEHLTPDEAKRLLKNHTALAEVELAPIAKSKTKQPKPKEKNKINQDWQTELEKMAYKLIKEGKKSLATKKNLAGQLAKKTGENAATIERNTRKTW